MFKSIQFSQRELEALVHILDNLMCDSLEFSPIGLDYALSLQCIIKLQSRLIVRVNKMTYEGRNLTTFQISSIDSIALKIMDNYMCFSDINGIDKNTINKIINPEIYEKKTNKKGLPKRRFKGRL